MLKYLLSFSSAIEANMIMAKLKSAGVECFLTNQNFTSYAPHLAHAAGGIRLMVSERDYDTACSILQEAADKALACPDCGSHNIRFHYGKGRLRNFFSLLLSLFMAQPMGSLRRKYFCRDCGCEFT